MNKYESNLYLCCSPSTDPNPPHSQTACTPPPPTHTHTKIKIQKRKKKQDQEKKPMGHCLHVLGCMCVCWLSAYAFRDPLLCVHTKAAFQCVRVGACAYCGWGPRTRVFVCVCVCLRQCVCVWAVVCGSSPGFLTEPPVACIFKIPFVLLSISHRVGY